MKLLIVMVTYNRLDYTKRTLDSLLSTISVPYFLVVADNASTDGTQTWLRNQHNKGKINHLILNDENLYPGKATNEGWESGLYYYPEATHLMRLDNDIKLYAGWDRMANEYFKKIPKLGQLGLDHGPTQLQDAPHYWEEYNGMKINPFPGNVGGPNIIRREVWEDGVRYDESRWSNDDDRPTPQEDCRFSLDIKDDGWLFGHPEEKIAVTIDKWEDYPEYFLQTMTERGYSKVFKEDLDKLRGMVGD